MGYMGASLTQCFLVALLNPHGDPFFLCSAQIVAGCTLVFLAKNGLPPLLMLLWSVSSANMWGDNIGPMEAPIIAPSILSADFAHLAQDLKAVNTADWIHVDIMDAHFVPNLTFGAAVTAAVHANTDKPLDVHMMIENPERWVDDYIDAGAYTAIFHIEATEDPVSLARRIRKRGCRAGFSLRPSTPIEPLLEILPEFDEVLVMSVEPGFGGQSFMPEQLDKVRLLRRTIDEKDLKIDINIDGGISRKTIAAAAAAGCDAFVAGSAVYGADNPAEEVNILRDLAAQARAMS